jgi:lipopolysaccharide export system permease protein
LTRLDRYILRHLIAALGFFALVFTGVVWLTQAVRLIDTVVASGQSARVFLEFSVLVLPQVLVIVLPLSGIGAALYALNKLYSDSELTVMMSAGLGPLALLRPVAIFGGLVALAMLVVTTVLVPFGGRELAERTQAIRSDLANALIVERQFLHPMQGLTLFITDTSRAGEMAGIFLNDQRDPERTVTYSAERALLLREGMEARLVMLDGVALSPGADGRELNSVLFDQFVFDLSDLIREQGERVPRPSEYALRDLLSPSAAMLERGRYDRSDFIAEAHYKLTLPLLAMLYPMIALVTLLAGGYRRSGFGRRVIVAIGVAVLIQVALFLIRPQVQQQAALWPLMYVPLLLGFAYVAALLVRLSSERRPAGLPA